MNQMEIDPNDVVCSLETMTAHPELYHYTALEAFENILRSNSLWAFHYSAMADKGEVLLMRDRLPPAVAPRLDELASTSGLNRHQRRLYAASGSGLGVANDLVRSLYGSTFLSKKVLGKLDAYLVSFSTHAHDSDFEREHGVASQWRLYAKSAGVCMVFDTAAMAGALLSECRARYWVRLRLESVRYADAPIEQLFPELVNASADTFRQFLGGTRYPEMAVPEFLTGATLLKGEAFKHEREVRIVAIPGTKQMSDRAAKEYPNEFEVKPLPQVHTVSHTKRTYVALFEGLAVPLPLKRVIVTASGDRDYNVETVRSVVGSIPVTVSRCELDTFDNAPK